MSPARSRIAEEQAYAQTLTLNGMAVILLDNLARIIAENKRARQMLCNEETLLRVNGTLTAANGYAAALAERIERVLRQNCHTREAMVMHIPSRRLPIAVTLQAYRFGRAAAAVIVADPGQAFAPDEELLRALYGLTAAEIRVACALATCRSISETACQQKMALHTVRTHLKSLFQKTRCHRQSELVALLLNTPSIPEILL
ncbi:MAG: helix-turn-helix transcriptional regulator [Acidobacteriota bacterium]